MADRAMSGGTHPHSQVTFRSLLLPVFLPAGLFGIGMGAAVPVIALTARDLGASIWVSAMVVALVGVGLVVADLPAGAVVARWGERISVVVGSTIGAAGVLMCLFAPSVVILAIGVMLTGIANAVWGLARQSYLAEVVPFPQRARIMATFALTMRLGMFLGPALGAGVIYLAESARGGFAVQLVATVAAGWLMARLPDLSRSPRGGVEVTDAVTGVAGVILAHRRVLATLGSGSVLMGASRASIPVVIPLWSDHLGLSAATASLIFAAGAAADVTFSYPAGYLMDRFSRRFIAVPSLLVLGIAYLLLPLSSSVGTLAAVAVVLGIGNGLGNGLIMTIGADLAPENARAEFLAAWRLTHDVGFLAGPLGVALIAAVAPFAGATIAMGAASFIGAAVFTRHLPGSKKISATTPNFHTAAPIKSG